MPQALFALVIFEMRSYFLPGSERTVTLLFMLPTVTGMTGQKNYAQLLVEMGVS
jgi:hypothetical protein